MVMTRTGHKTNWSWAGHDQTGHESHKTQPNLSFNERVVITKRCGVRHSSFTFYPAYFSRRFGLHYDLIGTQVANNDENAH